MKLKSRTLSAVKTWNDIYPTVLYDAKFLKKVAMDVFGRECLKNSSVLGQPARNSNVQHAALDATKLNFVRGNTRKI